MKTCLLLSCCLVAACAPSRPVLPDPQGERIEEERQRQYDEAAELWLAYSERLTRVGSRILVENAPLCNRRNRYLGVIAASRDDLRQIFPQGQFSEAFQNALARRYEIGDSVKVLHVLPGSPAAIGGIRAGDILRAGERVTQRDRQLLKFDLGRDNQVSTVTVEYVPMCEYSFVLTFSDEINARADGETILVTTAMLRFADTDDDLAIILAHELAHNMLSYLTRWGEPRTRDSRIRDEREADHVGIYLVARAGFDFRRAATLWRRWGVMSPNMISDRWSRVHPGTAERVVRMSESIAEVENKMRTGEPLVPYGMREPERPDR